MKKIDLPEGEKLTESEVRVLRLIFQGMTAKEAARELFVCKRTVEFHVRRVYSKLKTRGVLLARIRLEELGLLDQVMSER